MLDRAVVTFGTAIENALLERSEADDDGRSYPIYTLAQLLEPAFRLPRPDREPAANLPIGGKAFGMLYDEVG